MVFWSILECQSTLRSTGQLLIHFIRLYVLFTCPPLVKSLSQTLKDKYLPVSNKQICNIPCKEQPVERSLKSKISIVEQLKTRMCFSVAYFQVNIKHFFPPVGALNIKWFMCTLFLASASLRLHKQEYKIVWSSCGQCLAQENELVWI